MLIANENFGNIMANVDLLAKQTARRSIDAFDAPFGREFYQRNREMLKQIPITLGGDLLFIGYRKEIQLFRFITGPMIQNMKIALAV